jgi:nitrate reductase beta subunit
MDAFARRESYDQLLDEVHALVLDPADPDAVAAAVLENLPKLLEAAKHVRPDEPVLVAELRYHAANLSLILGQATKRAESLDRAKAFAEQGLKVIEGQDAKVLEAMLRYVRAGALTLEGQLSAAAADLSVVVTLLEPHVAEMRRVRASGNMAQQFAVELADRRVQAEWLLDEARAAASALGGVTHAIRSASSALGAPESEAVKAAERTNARAKDPRTRIIETAVITLVGTAGLWYFDSLLARLVIATIVLLSAVTTIVFLRRLGPAS